VLQNADGREIKSGRQNSASASRRRVMLGGAPAGTCVRPAEQARPVTEYSPPNALRDGHNSR